MFSFYDGCVNGKHKSYCVKMYVWCEYNHSVWRNPSRIIVSFRDQRRIDNEILWTWVLQMFFFLLRSLTKLIDVDLITRKTTGNTMIFFFDHREELWKWKLFLSTLSEWRWSIQRHNILWRLFSSNCGESISNVRWFVLYQLCLSHLLSRTHWPIEEKKQME